MKAAPHIDQEEHQECALYRHFAEDGTLLYVGISLNAVRRLSQHAYNPWMRQIANVSIEWLPSRDAAIAAEKAAIVAEKPKFNIVGTSKALRQNDGFLGVDFGDADEPLTAAERQQRKRDRVKAGLVRIEAWVPAETQQAVHDAIAAIIAAHKGE